MGKKEIENLNPEQTEAVRHVDGPLLVLSGAGTGKTTVIAHRTVNLIKNAGIDSSNILLLTFTNKVALEMKARVQAIAGQKVLSTISTFHSFAKKVIDEYWYHIDTNSEINWLHANAVYWTLKNKVEFPAKSYKHFKNDDYIAEVIRNIQSIKMHLNTLEDYDDDFKEIYRNYNLILKSEGKIDYDDALLFLNKLLDDEKIRNELSEKYKYIIVDEYQDSNEIQNEILEKLSRKYRNLCVVGDENQSIYAFNGGNVKFILGFQEKYNSKVINITKNYRCTKKILKAANNVIENNKEFSGKRLETDNEAGSDIKILTQYTGSKVYKKISEEILERVKNEKLKFKNFAVLSRSNYEISALQKVFGTFGIPYEYKTGSLLESYPIEHILLIFKVIDGTCSEDEFFEMLSRFVGVFSRTLKKNILKTSREKGISMLKTLNLRNKISSNLTVQQKCEFIGTNLLNFKKIHPVINKGNVVTLINTIRNMCDIVNMYQNKKKVMTDYLGAIVNLYNENSTIDIFLRSVSEMPGNWENTDEFIIEIMEHLTNEPPEDAVQMLTFHSAKGLEFDIVYLLGFDEKHFPKFVLPKQFPHLIKQMDENKIEKYLSEVLEEERRLCYVAITRAKKELTITYPKTVYDWEYQQNRNIKKSLFINEIKLHEVND
jgi:uvrD/REP helicase